MKNDSLFKRAAGQPVISTAPEAPSTSLEGREGCMDLPTKGYRVCVMRLSGATARHKRREGEYKGGA